MIRHILLIRFKTKTTAAEIESLKQAFKIMSYSIQGIDGFEWGSNDSPENKNKGYRHSVMITFKDETARQHYLPHPEHLKLKHVLRPLLEDIIVFDYST